MEKQLLDLLHDLVALDLDAIEAYEAAIDRLGSIADLQQVRVFRNDHMRHVDDLSAAIVERGGDPPTKPDWKHYLTEGRVVVMGLAGSLAVLKAMRTNEDESSLAYERARLRPDLGDELAALLQQNLDDERRHRAWLVARIERDEPATSPMP